MIETHTPDGLVTSWICIVMWIVSLACVAYTSYVFRRSLSKKKAMFFSVMTGLVFCLQLLNVPILNGTSGHVIGAALLAVLFGASGAITGLAVVLTLQALVFGDGGVISLGVNVFAMAVVGGATASKLYSFLLPYGRRLGIVAASLGSVLAAAATISFFLWVSGTASLLAIFSPMMEGHLLVGLLEMGATFIILAGLGNSAGSKQVSFKRSIGAAGIAIIVCMVGLPLISSLPDVLESTVLNLGFFEHTVTWYHAPFGEYAFFGVGSLVGAVGAACAGVVMSFGAALLISAGRKSS